MESTNTCYFCKVNPADPSDTTKLYPLYYLLQRKGNKLRFLELFVKIPQCKECKIRTDREDRRKGRITLFLFAVSFVLWFWYGVRLPDGMPLPSFSLLHLKLVILSSLSAALLSVFQVYILIHLFTLIKERLFRLTGLANQSEANAFNYPGIVELEKQKWVRDPRPSTEGPEHNQDLADAEIENLRDTVMQEGRKVLSRNGVMQLDINEQNGGQDLGDRDEKQTVETLSKWSYIYWIYHVILVIFVICLLFLVVIPLLFLVWRFGPTLIAKLPFVLPTFSWFLSCFLLFVIYFIPSVIAFRREHFYLRPIVVINVFLGWTVVGWIGALVWAVMPSKDKAPQIARPHD